MNSQSSQTLGAIVYPDVELLDLYGPLEMFGSLGDACKIITVSDRPGLVASSQGPKTHAEYTMSVCSGSAILARAGLLDGRRATSNKQLFQLATMQSDTVDWVEQARWVTASGFPRELIWRWR